MNKNWTWTLERYGYGMENNTDDLVDYFNKALEADISDKYLNEEDYWFFILFMTRITPALFWSIAVIGLISNIVVIMGKIRRFSIQI